MKNPMVRLMVALAFLFTILSHLGCNGSNETPTDLNAFRVQVNGLLQEGTVNTKLTTTARLIDVQALAAQLSVTYYSMQNPRFSGFTLQHGSRLSFVAADSVYGFVSGETLTMTPRIELADEVFWTPVHFLEKAVAGAIEIDEIKKVIQVTLPMPRPLGAHIAETLPIAQQLMAEFEVQRGEVGKGEPVDLYVGGYVEDANGNNAGANYMVTLVPPSTRNPNLNVAPVVLQMDQDEALVWVGYTPPSARYFSYQPYLMNRYLGDVTPPTIKKLFARLGDSINNYNLPLPGEDPFSQFYVLIIAANQDTYHKVAQVVQNVGIATHRIMTLAIPNQTDPNEPVNFGLTLTADSFNFLHRLSVGDSDSAQADYVNAPTIELLRVTPKTPLAVNPITRSPSQPRRTRVREQQLADVPDHLARLRKAIIDRFSREYRYVKLLQTSTWMYPGGDVAIAEREDVLGETNDTLYLKSQDFVLNPDDLIVVFGVNHDQTGKSVYSNVSCYGMAENGVGGILSTPTTVSAPSRQSYFGTAAAYLPDLDADQANRLYVYKFARQAHDNTTYAIPDNADGRFYGHNDGDTVFMGFRIYVDVLTTVGAYPGNVRDGAYFSEAGPPDSEVFFDQVMIFSNTVP
ncbi:MAG: hypothetical protein ACOYMW_15735 [Candidatus Competibacteraceae bacterium]